MESFFLSLKIFFKIYEKLTINNKKPTCVLFFLDFPLSKQEDKVLNADWNHENAMVCHLSVSIVLRIWGSKQGDQ